MITGRQIRRQRVKKKKWHERLYIVVKAFLERVIDSTGYGIFVAIITLYALFAPDIVILAFDRTADADNEIIMSIVFFMFVVEVFLFVWLVSDYFPRPGCFSPEKRNQAKQSRSRFSACMSLIAVGSFYFWLDVIAAASLIFEVRPCPPPPSSERLLDCLVAVWLFGALVRVRWGDELSQNTLNTPNTRAALLPWAGHVRR